MGNNSERKLSVVQIIMRLLVIGTALASTWIMVKSKEVVTLFGLSFSAQYSYSDTFRFFVYANAVVCGVTLLSAIYACIARRKGLGSSALFALFLCDLCLTMVAIAASAAATAEGNIGKKGNAHASWIAICPYVPHYCDRVTLSVALSFASSLLLFLLTILSASAARHR